MSFSYRELVDYLKSIKELEASIAEKQEQVQSLKAQLS